MLVASKIRSYNVKPMTLGKRQGLELCHDRIGVSINKGVASWKSSKSFSIAHFAHKDFPSEHGPR